MQSAQNIQSIRLAAAYNTNSNSIWDTYLVIVSFCPCWSTQQQLPTTYSDQITAVKTFCLMRMSTRTALSIDSSTWDCSMRKHLPILIRLTCFRSRCRKTFILLHVYVSSTPKRTKTVAVEQMRAYLYQVHLTRTERDLGILMRFVEIPSNP